MKSSAPGRSGPGVPGFTLIELLVVIAIIAILAAMLLPTRGYTYLLLNSTFPTLNFIGQRGGPSDLFILYDADDKDYTLADPSRRNEDYPDEGDNHGKEGANIIFCDGHAAWVTQKNYLRTWFRGTDEYHDPITP